MKLSKGRKESIRSILDALDDLCNSNRIDKLHHTFRPRDLKHRYDISPSKFANVSNELIELGAISVTHNGNHRRYGVHFDTEDIPSMLQRIRTP